MYDRERLLLVFVVTLCVGVLQQCEAHRKSVTWSEGRRVFVSIGLGLLSGVVLAFSAALLVRWFYRYVSTTPIVKGAVIFSPKIDPKTLQSALSSENHSLGCGNYYRTVLDNGLIVAVKKLEPLSESTKKRRVQQELELLAGLRDRNLMSLRAYVRGENNKFCLVYDHMPCGSLQDAINRVRENELQLGWDVRLRIAVGVIKGLLYLHSHAPQIVHRNLKPSNVMLDSQFEPRLADCALPSRPSPSPSSVYAAPETLQNGRFSDKSDIYSFGMMLGVLLTGREAETSLGEWLRQLQQAGDSREALDKSIVGEECEEDEMLMAVKIAVVCLSHVPAQRPSSDELVHMLTQLHSF